MSFNDLMMRCPHKITKDAIFETVSSFMEIVETFEYASQILFTIECSMQV